MTIRKDATLGFQELHGFILFIQQETGINLDSTKTYLLTTRLRPLLQRFEVNTFSELYQLLVRKSPDVMRAVVDQITTNETSFFRDQKPFDLLKFALVPELLAKDSNRPVRILSAACSTGQEVCSIAMSLKEVLSDLSRHTISITGLDISDDAVRAASWAQYSAFEVSRGLSAAQIERHFVSVDQGYRLNDELRAMARFKQGNLLDSRCLPGTFDIIFCRNVACYFSSENKTKLFEKLARCLSPDGKLIIGGTENLLGVTDRFVLKRDKGTVYYELG